MIPDGLEPGLVEDGTHRLCVAATWESRVELDTLEAGIDHSVHGIHTATADTNVKLVPETLEASNVNAVESLVQMISHGRQYDTAIESIPVRAEHEAQGFTSAYMLQV